MRFLRLLLSALLLSHAATANPQNLGTRIDSLGRFNVEVSVPAGTRHAVLEISSDPTSVAPWRKMVGCATDGRSGRVLFRLPVQAGDKTFARVRTGSETTPPPVELSDPGLVTLSYGPVIAEATKVTFLGNAAAKMREWSALPRSQKQQNLIAWALANPLVADAAVAPTAGNVSIRFTDGDICVLLNKPRTSADAGTPMPLAEGVQLEANPTFGPKAAPMVDLPGSNRAVTAFSLESTFPNSAPTIAGWLQSKGYATTNYLSTTVDQILSWSSSGSPLGVLFWHAHGCSFKKDDGSEGIGIITRQFADPYVSVPVYSEMRDGGELMLAIDEGQTLPYYGITSRFIYNRMHFAPHSIVMLDACFGGHPDLGNAFRARGAGSFAGWDWLSGDQSGTPCLKVFDRLLGTNQEPPISTPKERSFSLGIIEWWMNAFGYNYDPSPKYANQGRANAKLVWYHHPQRPGHILLPSVMRVLAEAHDEAEPYSKFLIEGDFGPDPGAAKRSVLWGGQPMQVVRWDPWNGIVIRMPAAPPRGEIQVITHKDYYSYSNKVPITEWTVPFKYEITSEGSLGATMDLNVKFRGDIHGSRGAPEMPPQYLGVIFSNMADCTGSITAGGTHHPNDATTVTWSGGSSLTSVDPANAGEGVLTDIIRTSGVMQIQGGRVDNFSLTANGSFTSTERVTLTNGGVRTTVTQETLPLDAFIFLMTEPLSFNPTTARLAGGSRPIWGENGSATLTWPAVTPQFAPDAQTIR